MLEIKGAVQKKILDRTMFKYESVASYVASNAFMLDEVDKNSAHYRPDNDKALTN